MSDKQRVLSPSAAQAYYDRFGKKQDWQGFYEDPALDELIAHAGLSISMPSCALGSGGLCIEGS